MEIKMIKTISGKEIDRKLCIKIGDDFYEKNVDCVNIDGRWYRKSNPKIYFNTIEDKYMKITENTFNGICGYNPSDNTYTMGRFEAKFEEQYKIKTKRGDFVCSSKKIFDSIPKIWRRQTGEFLDLAMCIYYQYNHGSDYAGNNYIYSFDRLYNSDKLIPIFQKVDNSKYTENLLGLINKSNKKFDIINEYSFGLEFETSAGIIPEHKCKQLGLIPLRDGSIKGHEYTTIPMIGEGGVNLLMNQMKALKNECTIDKECSLHVHFGGFSLIEENILRLYNLLYYLQDEIGELFHEYIFNTGSYKASGKDYCKRFKGKADSIDSLYSHLADGNATWDGDFYMQHPLDPRHDQKWNNNKRYYFVNLINMLFGTGAKTVEFRLHTPTFNETKVINWLFICMAILRYAETSEAKLSELESIKLKDVLEFAYGTDSNTYLTLVDYMDKRKSFFFKNYRVYGDTYGALDLLQDTDVEFKTPYHT